MSISQTDESNISVITVNMSRRCIVFTDSTGELVLSVFPLVMFISLHLHILFSTTGELYFFFRDNHANNNLINQCQ